MLLGFVSMVLHLDSMSGKVCLFGRRWAAATSRSRRDTWRSRRGTCHCSIALRLAGVALRADESKICAVLWCCGIPVLVVIWGLVL